MAVSSVSAATSSQYGGSKTGSVTGGLQDQFMQILLAQLRYQDPMAPMQERDFFGQMAQFTSATQMENMNGKMDEVLLMLGQNQANQGLLAAACLIGSAFRAASDGAMVDGIVESVALSGGKVSVRSGDLIIPVENLVSIGGKGGAG